MSPLNRPTNQIYTHYRCKTISKSRARVQAGTARNVWTRHGARPASSKHCTKPGSNTKYIVITSLSLAWVRHCIIKMPSECCHTYCFSRHLNSVPFGTYQPRSFPDQSASKYHRTTAWTFSEKAHHHFWKWSVHASPGQTLARFLLDIFQFIKKSNSYDKFSESKKYGEYILFSNFQNVQIKIRYANLTATFILNLTTEFILLIFKAVLLTFPTNPYCIFFTQIGRNWRSLWRHF